MSVPVDVDRLLAYDIPGATDAYDARDTILYALGTGAGLAPGYDETQLLYEERLLALPTMALVLGTPGFWPMDPATGLDFLAFLHAEQRLVIHRPLAPEGVVSGATRITELADKGPGKAALIRAEKQLRDADGELVATATEVWFVKGAGGFGGEREISGDPLPPAPDRVPDFEVDLPTSRAQAAVYRLSGDRNPLHIDPVTAQRAGFERPILHGLSTMGLVARALIHALCASDPAMLREIGVRFSSPVFPGETIRTHIWQNGPEVRFRAFVIERGVCVIDNGTATLV